VEEQVVNKMDPVFRGDGWSLYATENSDLQIIEWEDLFACRMAYELHNMLRRHALNTSYVQKYQGRGLVVRRLEYLPLSVLVKATAHDSELSFLREDGTPIPREQLEAVPGAKKNRIAVMEDVGLHTIRSLRAYLAQLDIQELQLRLHFGIGPEGALSLQVPNPLECHFGTTDYQALCDRLCGDK
jgi:hypothetical protein